ncbi:hypothetical protein BpHYR1_021669 [Brachionus plicatilis]|uniref:Uncharacterized protein n=1 Tax=Brachionus plicatilis TaxID=10195 RepID=A0A3M7RV65_BRAPC|nr:hypothetical protein BpHYR1_021669 [Brachionus plicatilis]
MAGRPCTDWPATKRSKKKFYQDHRSKIFIWTVLWPTGLHTVSRLTAFQLAGHFTVGLSGGRPWKDRPF